VQLLNLAAIMGTLLVFAETAYMEEVGAWRLNPCTDFTP